MWVAELPGDEPNGLVLRPDKHHWVDVAASGCGHAFGNCRSFFLKRKYKIYTSCTTGRDVPCCNKMMGSWLIFLGQNKESSHNYVHIWILIFFSQAIMSSVEEMMIYRIRRKTCWQYIRFQFSSYYVLIYALNDNMPPCAIYTRNMFFFCIIIHYKIIVCLPLVEFQSWKDMKFPREGS